MIGTLIQLTAKDHCELEMWLREEMKNSFEGLYDGNTTLKQAKKEYDGWLVTKLMKQFHSKSYQDTWDNFAWHLEHEHGLTPNRKSK